ncbi:PREDICTED: flavin reductase (NADPH) [Nicrophorus vespilloides]|uniref:Flavin reductase (NADPH) n=1 Tax=Nicrophorus vespilloides TaxID=110193 RepID=A0ABM1M0T8_NICVS|nr:PREDICTED: flavin reductase (NADPH) [Nicrophorus vespilloides]
MDKIAIFGSTGMTGTCALKAAIDKGLKIKVLVRDPSKIPEEFRPKVEVIHGDVLKYEDVLETVKNVQSVVVVLGTRNNLKPTTDLSEGMKNIVRAMNETNIEVVSVCLSAFLFYEPSKVPPMFVDLNADHQRQLKVVLGSSLKYIAILPPHIADSPQTEYVVEVGKSPGRAVSKYDLGRFLVESLSEEKYYGRLCGIYSPQ